MTSSGSGSPASSAISYLHLPPELFRTMSAHEERIGLNGRQSSDMRSDAPLRVRCIGVKVSERARWSASSSETSRS
eukprot:4795732-Prymnesium_polylepis.2